MQKNYALGSYTYIHGKKKDRKRKKKLNINKLV